MHMETKYNIGDKVFVYNNWSKIEQVVICSIYIEIETPGDSRPSSISYNVRFNDGTFRKFYEESVYTNIQAIIAREEKKEQDDINLAKESYDTKIATIKENYVQRYRYLSHISKKY